MELNKQRYKQVGSGAGMVLLLSLSIILLMSVALMKAFEKKTIEISLLQNSARRFETETLSRSVLKVILLTIKESGLISIVGNERIWKGQIFPLEGLENGYFEILEIKPLDHLMNLNRKTTKSNGSIRSIMFHNIVNIIREEEDPDSLEITQTESDEALSALIDWTDVDNELDTIFMHDHEYYPGETPSFDVKNQILDRLSEIKTIPAIRSLGIVSSSKYEEYFRASQEASLETIDINLAKKGEVESFLRCFENIPEYETVYFGRERLDEIVTEDAEDNGDTVLDPITGTKPRFQVDNFHKKNESEWYQRLNTEGIELSPNEEALFKPTTEHLRIRFLVGSGNVSTVSEVIARLSYAPNRATIQKIVILSYQTN